MIKMVQVVYNNDFNDVFYYSKQYINIFEYEIVLLKYYIQSFKSRIINIIGIKVLFIYNIVF